MEHLENHLGRKLSIGAIARSRCEMYDAYESWAYPMGKTQDDLDVMREHNINVFSRASTRGTVDLATEAVENLLAENQFDPDSIDLIIYFHSLPSSTEAAPKSVISEVRNRTGIKADGFSVSQVRCASFSVALNIIERIFKSPHSSVKTVLVIGADVVYAEEYRAISRGDMEGDGAVAALIHKEDRGTNVYITNMLFEGQYYAAFKWNNGKLQGPAAVHYRTTGTLLMIKILADTLKKAALKPDDISLVLTHNGSFPWWDKIMETMRISPDLIFKGNNDVTAHLMSSDILSNLKACREQQLLKPGDKFIILNAGVGRTFGCAVAQA